MSRIVAGLARSRLVTISKDPADARRMRIRATAKGIKLLQDARQARISDLAKQLERLSGEDLSRIGAAVSMLAEILQKWR